jgi:glycosyltransferase involved in cell wall biosynthesis
MATGCACIGTKVGGIPELVVDRAHGRLVAPGDVQAMALALHELANHEAMRRGFGREGVSRIKILRMNQKAMVEAHQAMYRASIAEASR